MAHIALQFTCTKFRVLFLLLPGYLTKPRKTPVSFQIKLGCRLQIHQSYTCSKYVHIRRSLMIIVWYYFYIRRYKGFHKWWVHQMDWFIMETHIKMDDLGVTLFQETSRCASPSLKFHWSIVWFRWFQWFQAIPKMCVSASRRIS